MCRLSVSSWGTRVRELTIAIARFTPLSDRVCHDVVALFVCGPAFLVRTDPTPTPPTIPVDDRMILAIRDECLADDVDILPGMCVWSEDEIFAYFESGGSMRPPDNELLLRQINRKWQALGALGQQAVMMPGEARGAGKCLIPT